jgi:hypothetical protein
VKRGNRFIEGVENPEGLATRRGRPELKHVFDNKQVRGGRKSLLAGFYIGIMALCHLIFGALVDAATGGANQKALGI